MNNIVRFDFPGYTHIRAQDTETHEVEVGSIKTNDTTFVVHLIRNIDLKFDGNFLLAKVFNANESEKLWEFPKGYPGLGFLAEVHGNVMLALVQRGKRPKVEKVIPLSSFVDHKQIDMLSQARMKQDAADFLYCECFLTDIEKKLLARAEAKERAAREAAEAAAREQKERERVNLIARILARGRFDAFTKNGLHRTGYPVVESEWPVLQNETHVILVESFDEENNKPGNAIEAFKIGKSEGGRLKKISPAPVTWTKPNVTLVDQPLKPEAPMPVDKIYVDIDEVPYEVLVFATMDDLRKARSGGLNSGTYATAKDKLVAGKKPGEVRYEIFSVHTEKMESVGLLEAIRL